MKKLFSVLFILCVAIMGCKAEGKKSIVAYFSATGTTKKVAVSIAAKAKAEFYAINPEEIYTENDLNWRNSRSRTTIEMMDEKSRPALKEKKDLSEYDVIYLGFPIWWGVAPHIINTFIEQANMNGKTVVVFATSGGDGVDKAFKALKDAYPNINWQQGYLLNKPKSKQIEAIIIKDEKKEAK